MQIVVPSRVGSVWIASALVLAAALLGPLAQARAQDDGCDDEPSLARGPVEITPSVGARAVTLDAPIAVRYSAGYFGPEGPGDDPTTLMRLVRCPPGPTPGCTPGCAADEGVDVPGTVQVIEDRLFFFADAGLEPDTTYSGRASGMDDVIDFTFCTGDDVDRGPPTLGGFLSAEPSESTAACVLPEGGRLVSVRWGQAEDDGPGGSIEYLLYLTRAAGVEAPELRDRVRNYASGEITLSLRLDAEEAAEPVCIRMVALDGVGNTTEPSPEECFDPMTAAAFQPLCAVRGGAGADGRGRASVPAIAAFSLTLAGLALRRRSARRRDGAPRPCIR